MKSLLFATMMLHAGGGRYLGQDYNAAWRGPNGRYELGARVKSFRYLDAFDGTVVEYSARVARHLPHVSIGARVGTAPPNAQRAAYHLAAGEATLTFYGLTLGPSHPETLATVAEDTTTLAELSHLDSDWVTRGRARFTSTNHHQSPPSALAKGFDLVQNSWQFDASLTWKRRTRLALDGGGDRYSRTVLGSDPTWYLWNVDYAGAPIAVRGWPKNHVGARFEQELGAFSARAGFTRITMLSGDLEVLAGGEGAWRPGEPLELRIGWHQRHQRHHETRAVWSAGASYRW